MKQFCKQFAKLAMLAIAFVMLAWCMGTEAEAAATYLKPYPKANYETTSPYYALTVDGQKVDVVYYFEHRGTETKLSAGRFAYAHLAYEGTATFEITNLTGDFGSYNLSPHSYGMNAKVDGNKLTFDLTQADSRYIVLQTTINGNNEILVIACDPMENYDQYLEVDRVVNVVEDYGADNTGKNLAGDKIQNAINDVSSAGGGTVYVPAGVYKIIYIDGKSNVTLYLDAGAVLRGTGNTDDYTWDDSGANGRQGRRDIKVSNCKNFGIVGRGMIDGNSIALVQDKGTNGVDGWDDFRKGIVEGSNSTGFFMDGVTVKDSAGWTFSVNTSKDITIKNVKLLADFNFIHTDGYDFCSCEDVYITDCLGVCGDDVFCPKAQMSNDMKNYLIENGVAFAHGGAGAKIGMQARGYTENIVFRNIDVVQGYRSFTVAHDTGSANWKNLVFEDIRMEKLNTHTGTGGQFRCGPFVIWVWGSSECKTAVVDGVTVNRCSVENNQGKMAWLQGTLDESKGADAWVKNVTFTDMSINGVVLTDDNYSEYVNHGVNIENIHYYAVASESAVTYEAENATLSNTTTNSKDWASNGKTVGDVGLITADDGSTKLGTVTFNVEHETGGTTELGIYCAVKGERSYFVTVNGGEPIEVAFTGTDWNAVVNKSITVQLKAGSNTILITNPNEPGPNLDCITVRHIHSLSEDWSYDETYHWHDYNCGHDLTGQKSAHRDSNSDYFCDTCSYNMAPADPEDIIVTEYEAENAVLTGATAVTNAEASNGAHAGDIGGANDGTVTFNITETGDCTATLSIYYIQDATRSFEVSVNGESKTVACSDGNSWTAPLSTPKTMTINLKKGENTIAFSGVGTEYAPNLDKISLTHIHKYDQTWTTDEVGHWQTPTCGHDDQRKNYGEHIDADGSTYCDVCNYKTSDVELPADGGASTVIFDKEAESGTFSNGAGAVTNSAASNGGHAGNLGGSSDGTVSFTFNSTVSGTYTLSLYYIQDDTRQFEVDVNGTVYTVNTPSSGSWTNPAAEPVTLQVNIASGSNTIKVSGVGTAYAPNLDRLVVEDPHTYTDVWSYTEEYHWRAATCGHDLVTDPGLHLGMDDDTCDVCGYSAYVPSVPAQNAILMADSVTAEAGSEVRVPLYLKNAAGLADLEGSDGNIGTFQITVASDDNLVLTGFESELLADLDPWVGEGNGNVVGFTMGSGISLSSITDDVPIAYLVFSSGSEAGAFTVSFSKVEFIDGMATDYSDYVEAQPFTITLEEAAKPVLFDIYGANMTLGNDLSMSFFIEKADLNGTDYYAVITKSYADGRDDVTVTVDFADWKTYGSTMYFVTFNGIAAKEMCDDIDVTIYNGDGTVASNVWTDSVRSYAERIFNSQTTAVKTLLADMLNYGAAAQTSMGYDTANLANSGLTSAQAAYATDSVAFVDNRVKGTNYYGSTLSLESNILLYMFFNNVTTDMNAVVTYTDFRGNTVTENISGADFYVRGALTGVVVDDLVVADGFCLVTCEVYDGDTLVASASDSLESYCARMAASDATCEATMKFVDSARNYLLNK